MGVMTPGVEDRTQVLRVSLKTEAALLRSWLARRDELAQRRRDAPLVVRRHRRALLEREVPRLEREVAGLERRPMTRGSTFEVISGFVRGVLRAVAAAGWVVGVAVATPLGRFDDPLRLAAMAVVPLIVWSVRR